MKKLYVILIIIGSIIVVATPTIFLSVYFIAKNQVSNADVNIAGIEVKDISDDSLIADVNFTVGSPSEAEATFKVLDIHVNYSSSLLGICQLVTSEFSTQDTSHLTEFTLNITNEVAFSGFVSDFITLETLEVDLGITFEFTGALAALPIQHLTKTLNFSGLNSLPIELRTFELLDVSDDELQLDVEVGMNNPSLLGLTVDSLYADIYYQDTIIGNISKTNVAIINGFNIIEVETWLGGNTPLLADFISEYLSPDNITVDINLTATLENFEGDGFIVNQLLTDVEVKGLEEDLVSIEVEMINLNLSGLLGSLTYTIDTIVTINNPTNFAINITAFDGLLVYDDDDGASYVIPLVFGWDFDPEENITITPVIFDWSSSPLEIAASGSAEDTYSYVDSNIEQGIRLNDEYFVNNQFAC